MDPFPEVWELLSLFEAEPTLSDPELPLFYNAITFETKRGDDEIRCEIFPASGNFEFVWTQHGELRLHIVLRCVEGMSVFTGNGRDVLSLSFRDDHMEEIEIQLRPHVSCVWGKTHVLRHR